MLIEPSVPPSPPPPAFSACSLSRSPHENEPPQSRWLILLDRLLAQEGAKEVPQHRGLAQRRSEFARMVGFAWVCWLAEPGFLGHSSYCLWPPVRQVKLPRLIALNAFLFFSPNVSFGVSAVLKCLLFVFSVLFSKLFVGC